MKKNSHRNYLCLLFLVLFLPFHDVAAQSTEDLQRTFTELRFGMFIHFSIMTFTGAAWATPNQDVSKFNPADLDCNQWADAAASAKMKFGILTTKHHDGFCLWPSAYTTNSVASSPWKNGKGDVVREFVDAFRSHGLYPCLYYSIWDNTKGVGNKPISKQDMDFIEGQLTELLSNYGTIKLLFIDGWSWKMGHVAVPYNEIRALVKKLQPGCLLVDNTHLQCLYENDMVFYEAGQLLPADNSVPALQSELINKNSGDDWFWDKRVPTAPLMSTSEIVDELKYVEPKWCGFVLNCPPDTMGKLDSNIVTQLKEVGGAWDPDTTRPALPKQAPFIENEVTPSSASASSGNASYAIDGVNDRYYYSVWQSNQSLPQSITIDLGKVYNNISMLNYVPKYVTVASPVTDGAIESYEVSVSVNDSAFNEVASGAWDGNSKMKSVVFPPVQARYLKIEAVTAVSGYAAATEFEIGTNDSTTSGKKDRKEKIPDSFKLGQNFPNPFNPGTAITYQLPDVSYVRLAVYDVLGREVSTLVSERQNAGRYTVRFDASNLSSGIYFYRLSAGSTCLVGKAVLVK